MTEEDINKEADKYFKSICSDYNEELERTGKRHYWVGFDIKNAYIAGAEPREKRIAELEKENKVLAQNLEDTEILNKTYEKRFNDLEKENAELRKVAEFQQSSNMSRHFENKKIKEGLAIGSILNKGLNSLNKALEEERDKYRNMVFDKDKQLTKAKEIICEYVRLANLEKEDTVAIWQLYHKAEQFLKDCEVEK